VKRIRRTPEEARRLILEAAEAVMARTGPGGLRLQEVAEAAGVSHPTILHHFESREGLMRALNQRTLEELGEVLRSQMAAPASHSGDAVRAAFAAYRGGFAQRMLWMLQSGAPPTRGTTLFDDMIDRLHALRVQLTPPERRPEREDSEAVVHLITIAAFGDAVIGQRLRKTEDDPAAETAQRARFETWLGQLLNQHIAGRP
jgi:AcrR family transcriptional regulator